jgi:hypothetical protein
LGRTAQARSQGGRLPSPSSRRFFDRRDVVRLLGYAPARTTLFRALDRLRDDGVIAIETYSEGGTTARYRKL